MDFNPFRNSLNKNYDEKKNTWNDNQTSEIKNKDRFFYFKRFDVSKNNTVTKEIGNIRYLNMAANQSAVKPEV